MNEVEIEDKKIRFLRSRLLRWFGVNGRNFPWRIPNLSSYEYVISEILLQRTRAETIASFYLPFLQRFPSWYSISSTPEKEVQLALAPIGLFRQRGTRLKRLANEMVRRNGLLPDDRDELDSIPFMGQYIANAVELLIYNKRRPLLDVNMARVLERFFKPRQLADIRYDPFLQRLSIKVVNVKEPRLLNWAILDFAALICKARNPLCDQCPISKHCNYYKSFVAPTSR
ncbi:MAG: hypothetical protein EOP48_00600 [Sphingobacteriales bacterium]|nr:MAG: hypothetical protein EOP48_00600 [Sphingobacteriales bacterium]